MEGDAYSADYYSARESWRDWWLEAEELVRLATLSRGGRALEIGCGSGGMLRILEQAGVQPTGVDTQLSALEWSRHRSDLTTRTQVVQIAASEALPFSADTFDAILGQHVAEHLPNLDSALGEWRRILKPGGRIVIATPNALYPDPAHFEDREHVCVYFPEELGSRVERAGFAVDSLETMFPYLTRVRLLRAAGVRAYRLFQRLPHFAHTGRTLVLSGRAVK